MKLIILEGARGSGKSTLARRMRESINYATLVNPTGFKDDGNIGLLKIKNYYDSWAMFLHQTQDIQETLIFDRLFFTERVFSELYKSYDFSNVYENLCRNLTLFTNQIDLVYLTISDPKELKIRLNRDKVQFANVRESIEETFKQQEKYDKVIEDFEDKYYTENKVRIHKIDSTYFTFDQLFNKVMEEIDR
ncbi:hypothetical protein [Chengkuizengella marina]|uniref:Thymidylate kinase n=1 Tax=Chengkuizengella marina TaxID=2507566 RepID=A0A6N9Q1F7_9BACL|nr:hypothetical protein [Chengkuizengella marina]NBI28663.1 hypothetical protein [Chengkuizengella marina]